jgi:hypothetical protein
MKVRGLFVVRNLRGSQFDYTTRSKHLERKGFAEDAQSAAETANKTRTATTRKERLTRKLQVLRAPACK